MKVAEGTVRKATRAAGEIGLWAAGGVFGGVIYALLLGDWDWGRFMVGVAVCLIAGVYRLCGVL